MAGLAGMFLNFGAVTLLPLAEATTFNFTSAIWAVVLSALVLHERIGRWRWGAVLLGFAGVLIISSALCLTAFAALWMIPVPQPTVSHAD